MDEIKCPKCGSVDTGQDTYTWFDGGEVVVTLCKQCGFFAAGTTLEGSLKTFENGGVERAEL